MEKFQLRSIIRNSYGVTLIELVVSLGLLSVLIGGIILPLNKIFFDSGVSSSEKSMKFIEIYQFLNVFKKDLNVAIKVEGDSKEVLITYSLFNTISNSIIRDQQFRYFFDSINKKITRFVIDSTNPYPGKESKFHLTNINNFSFCMPGGSLPSPLPSTWVNGGSITDCIDFDPSNIIKNMGESVNRLAVKFNIEYLESTRATTRMIPFSFVTKLIKENNTDPSISIFR